MNTQHLAFIFTSMTLLIGYMTIRQPLFPFELVAFTTPSTLLYSLAHSGVSFLGHNHWGLRAMNTLLYPLNFLLFAYVLRLLKVSRLVALTTLILYLFLPGIIGTAIVLSQAPTILSGVLIFLIISLRFPFLSYPILPLFVLIDNAFFTLALGMGMYSFLMKEYKKFFLAFFSVLLSLAIYGFEIGGKPHGYFVDALSVYSAVFSPFLFIFIVYALFKRFKTTYTVLDILALGAFLLSLILSFRQHISYVDFAPFLLLALPGAVEVYYNEYNIRLSRFRTRFIFIRGLIAVTLLVIFFSLLFSPLLYRFYDKPERHFLYESDYYAAILSDSKSRFPQGISTSEQTLKNYLAFYDKPMNGTVVISTRSSSQGEKVTLIRDGKPFGTYYVTKIHINR